MRSQPSTLKYRWQNGFTLVEMAIVLVIIGLLLGGVLKGQALVEQARVKSLINDYNQTTAAYYTYFDRYHRFPGDDATAETRWSTTANGNSNGFIGAANTGYDDSTTENGNVWWHFRLAGIVSGSTDTTNGPMPPVNSVGGVTGIQEGAFGINETVICSSNIPVLLAELIDLAIDDGDATSGIVRTSTDISATAPTAAYSAITATTVVCRRI